METCAKRRVFQDKLFATEPIQRRFVVFFLFFVLCSADGCKLFRAHLIQWLKFSNPHKRLASSPRNSQNSNVLFPAFFLFLFLFLFLFFFLLFRVFAVLCFVSRLAIDASKAIARTIVPISFLAKMMKGDSNMPLSGEAVCFCD